MKKIAHVFNYDLDFKSLNFRQNPHLYRIGKGEQGVLLVQPYKGEILPMWKFKTPDLAKVSAENIYQKFLNYLQSNDFVGADMARKFLQMGFTRARRYANRASGRKYAQTSPASVPSAYPYSQGSKYKATNEVLPQLSDALTNEKAQSAAIFKEYWFKAKEHPEYLRQKEMFIKTLEPSQKEMAV